MTSIAINGYMVLPIFAGIARAQTVDSQCSFGPDDSDCIIMQSRERLYNPNLAWGGASIIRADLLRQSGRVNQNSLNYKILWAEIDALDGKFTQGVETLKRISDANPALVYVCFALGLLYAKTTDWAAAKQYFIEAQPRAKIATDPREKEYGRLAEEKISECDRNLDMIRDISPSPAK